MNVLGIITWLLSIFSSPEDKGPGTILEIAKEQGATTFVQYAQRSNWILNELVNGTDYTALVPTNGAFEDLPKIVRTALQDDEVLEWYLRYHLGLSQIRTADIEDNFLLPTAFKPPQATDFPVQQIRCNIYSVPNDEPEGAAIIGEGESTSHTTRKVEIILLGYTVKNNRNFTDRVMGNCDKKSTVNREFTGKCPYILYINGQFTVLLQIFRKFTGNLPYFTGFTVYSPENLLPGNAP